MVGTSTFSETEPTSTGTRPQSPSLARPKAVHTGLAYAAAASSSTRRVATRSVLRAEDLPGITPSCALFLDFDGTLADLMLTPEDVRLSQSTRASMLFQQRHLANALAIVTGRAIEDLDRLVAPLKLTAAGMHGAEMRLSDDVIVRSRDVAPETGATLRHVAAKLRPLISLHTGLRLETKSLALSLHYRAAPQHAALCWQAAVGATRGLPELDVRPGKMVVEIVPRAADKGTAIRAIMASAPFVGRMPMFAGDDAADEDAIATVQAMGGIGIRIVDDAQTPTCAAYSVNSAHIIRAWLSQKHAQV